MTRVIIYCHQYGYTTVEGIFTDEPNGVCIQKVFMSGKKFEIKKGFFKDGKKEGLFVVMNVDIDEQHLTDNDFSIYRYIGGIVNNNICHYEKRKNGSHFLFNAKDNRGNDNGLCIKYINADSFTVITYEVDDTVVYANFYFDNGVFKLTSLKIISYVDLDDEDNMSDRENIIKVEIGDYYISFDIHYCDKNMVDLEMEIPFQVPTPTSVSSFKDGV